MVSLADSLQLSTKENDVSLTVIWRVIVTSMVICRV